MRELQGRAAIEEDVVDLAIAAGRGGDAGDGAGDAGDLLERAEIGVVGPEGAEEENVVFLAAGEATAFIADGADQLDQGRQLLVEPVGGRVHVDQREGEGFVGGRAAGAEPGGQRRMTELAGTRIDGEDRGAVDVDAVGVEEESGEIVDGIAADLRRDDKVVVPPGGVDQLDQLDQERLVAGFDVLEGHEVEAADDLHQAAGDLCLASLA